MQNQIMKCADARHFIHLAVGDDTLPEEEQQLAEHLHVCSDCRAYHAGMVDAMHAIERVRGEDTAEMPSGSLWPAMAGRLKARRNNRVTEPERRRFNGAVVALCACSLMLALVTAVQNLPANSVDPYADFPAMPVRAMNVNFQNHGNSLQPRNGQQRLVPVATADGSFILVNPVTSLPVNNRLEF